jgi:4-alpha-glucanotransferase
MTAQFLSGTPAAKHWEIVGVKHHDGINLPLFSLHSQTSCGVGEYPDLLPLISWCKDLGFDVIQLLPLNDTGPETSPYNALSAHALNPIHLGLAHLPQIEHYPALQKQIQELQHLTTKRRIPYPQIHKGKRRFLQEYFHHVSPSIVNTSDYLEFVEQNPWLEGYALFKVLKIQEHWRGWEDWNASIKTPSPTTYQHLVKQFHDKITFHIFIQYFCFQQLREVKKQANANEIFLKGDIPILINRESADVWLDPSLFLLQYAAGAPPDVYAKEGQKWGFPIYNWEEMEKKQYAWWLSRLKVACGLYDLYRLDHVVGFFRIWAIPINLPAPKGKFIPENKSDWITQGEKIMRMMLLHCSLLPIAEDLGVVPTEVRRCLYSLGICGTKVMRWERKWDTDKSYIKPQDYLIESMTTVSTHDSPTLPLWWKTHPQEAQDYAKLKGWTYSPELTHDQLFSILRDSHHTASLFHINLLQEYLALVPGMTWPKIEDERVNIPGIISNRNWTYRFRPSVEEIIANDDLRNEMQHLLKG